MTLFQYGLVFDAGSSHTSLFVYQWPEEKENNTGMVSQMFSCNVKAMRVIPPERQQESPVYLGATAGMRLLRTQNKSAAAQILEAVSQTIQKYPVNFQALDLGGASTQISFIPAGPIADPSEALQFRLYGFDYTIYSHSYLCYGQNEAFQRVIRLILVSEPDGDLEATGKGGR
ncbi:hypothetical protein Chor_002080 [Crotalus horridus]